MTKGRFWEEEEATVREWRFRKGQDEGSYFRKINLREERKDLHDGRRGEGVERFSFQVIFHPLHPPR